MSGEDFYAEFKASLDFLGPGFRGMNQVVVYFKEGRLCLSFDGKEVRLNIPSEVIS